METALIRLVVADDHPMILDGIKAMIKGEEKYEIVGIAHSVRAIFSVISNCKPDLALLDLNLSGDNILDFVDDLKARFPKLKLLIISSYDEATFIKIAKQKGINGYIFKNTNKYEFLEALNKIMAGEVYYSSDIYEKKKSVQLPFDKEDLKDDFSKRIKLSNREIEIIQLIAEGHTEFKIAEILFLSKHTVHTHRKNIMKKLNVKGAVELVRFAFENKLL